MTFAAVPALNATPSVGGVWNPQLRSMRYDERDLPLTEKVSATLGMSMTEKQGGSDVRANTTRATPVSVAAAGELGGRSEGRQKIQSFAGIRRGREDKRALPI